MPDQSKKGDRTEEITQAIHRFSNEAFGLAKQIVAGSAAEPLKERATGLKARVPELAALMRDADAAYRADLNRALSEARLDLDYVLAGGGRPSSMRLGHVIREQGAGDNRLK